ncbi:MAG: hydrolase [Legionellales bacterium]|nr:hydrolase [Legionellales bacterium]
MIVISGFKPAWWLANPHAQTIYASFARKKTVLDTRSERLELPDGDFVELVWFDCGLSSDAPLVILLHGLGGTASSQYIKAQMTSYKQWGWRSVVMNLRGAGSEPNRMLRSFHAGDTVDLNYFLHTLHAREPHTKKMGVGFSLGGNILLKWLGEHSAQELLSAAVAVSVPFQLSSVADRLNQGFSRLYQKHLLNGLRQHFLRKMQKNSNQDLLQKLRDCHCFWTFDNDITAPLNGFDSVHSYYRESSCKSYLRHISTPTLVLHALDDPFMTSDVVPSLAELSPSISLELSQHGGHVGFISGTVPGYPKFWLDDRIAEFLAMQVN